jgi:putative ABC transport system substrate-binding protein
LRAAEAAARSLVLRLHTATVQRPEDLGPRFVEMQNFRVEALIVPSSAFFGGQRARIVALAAKHRIPTIYNEKGFVTRSGGLMSYGPDLRDLFRRAAAYVDKILKGVKPGDLPIEQPTKFELVVNLRAATALNLTLPQLLLARVDEVVQ